MANKKTCDKCGAAIPLEIEGHVYWSEVSREVVSYTPVGFFGNYLPERHDKRLDLCPNCNALLDKFLACREPMEMPRRKKDLEEAVRAYRDATTLSDGSVLSVSEIAELVRLKDEGRLSSIPIGVNQEVWCTEVNHSREPVKCHVTVAESRFWIAPDGPIPWGGPFMESDIGKRIFPTFVDALRHQESISPLTDHCEDCPKYKLSKHPATFSAGNLPKAPVCTADHLPDDCPIWLETKEQIKRQAKERKEKD